MLKAAVFCCSVEEPVIVNFVKRSNLKMPAYHLTCWPVDHHSVKTSCTVC